MTRYTIYNLIVLIIAVSILFLFHKEKKYILENIRIAVIFTVLALPWDFFAIKNQAWIYPVDPGERIYDVPLNDLVFIFSCTLISASVFGRFLFDLDIFKSKSKSENTGDKYPQD